MLENKKLVGLVLTVLLILGGIFAYANVNTNGTYRHMNNSEVHRNGTNNHMYDNNHMNYRTTSTEVPTTNKSTTTNTTKDALVNNKINTEIYDEKYIKEMEEYRKEANEFRKKLLEEDYKAGRITKNERDLWLDYYKDMEKYEDSGIGYGYGGGCHGGNRMHGGHNGMGNGHHGMRY